MSRDEDDDFLYGGSTEPAQPPTGKNDSLSYHISLYYISQGAIQLTFFLSHPHTFVLCVNAINL